MLVDNAIVVLENIFRRRSENDEAPEEASVEGAREVGPAIIASTITTLVIFLPLIFVRGVSGILFKELAYVIIFALICSLTVALSLVPMLASRLLTSGQQALEATVSRRNRWAAAANSVFTGLENVYLDLLRWVLAQQGSRHLQVVKDRRYRAQARGIPPRVWRRRSALLLMLKQKQEWIAE